MTIQTAGQISMFDLKNEFGGPASPSLFDYYAGGANVPDSIVGIPSSGTINLFSFYGTAKTFPIQYFTPGTYSVIVPASTNIMSAYLAGGGGGGGGGGGAGEYNWYPSSSGGGGGGGGAGQDIVGAWNVTPGSTLTIVVGTGGAGGAGGSGAFGARGDSARYDGYNGSSGGNGNGSSIAGLVGVSGGSGGSAGIGAPGDNTSAVVPGGSSGAGWPAGAAGAYAHIENTFYLSNGSAANPFDPLTNNLAPGDGGFGGFKSYGFAGDGGRGGKWDPYSYEYFPPARIAINGSSGGNGYVILQFGTTTRPRPASDINFSGGVSSQQPPYDPYDHSPPPVCRCN
jgi:hypothetical protein